MKEFPFVDRERELGELRRVLGSREPQLVRVYGRRRVGKTALLRETLRGRDGLYLVADEGEPPVQRELLAAQIAQFTGRGAPVLRSWDDLLDEIERLSPEVTVLDEFPFLWAGDHSVGTRLQHRWDAKHGRLGTHLVLCGSSIRMMRQLVGGRTGPLFGRLTADLRVRGLTYPAVRQFYPGLPEQDRVARFAVFGRSPFNHRLTRERPSLQEAVTAAYLSDSARLRDEPRTLLREGVSAPERYASVLQAIGRGARSLPDLEHALGVRQGTLSRSLRVLEEDLDMIRRVGPIAGRARRARYEFADPSLGFHYRLIVPQERRLELGDIDGAWASLAKDLEGHVGRVFETVVRELLLEKRGSTLGPFKLDFHDIGSWWSRTGEEIDVVAVGEEELLVGEVKWSPRGVTEDDVRRLVWKGGLIEERGRRRVRPFVVVRGEPSPRIRDFLEREGGAAFSLADLLPG
ncbi:MAG: ATP-binding protein [Euryarchaeota archaeon]|nr:ATP-binding protein [Euryarchaeota archaeon]MDE1837937.1 ATP-binding protein [Euryarchaeota archaeon]MDE1880181.1 ATP-binding protein [Euryarchaeota archaeon]MDE2045398.1 ATP-binding protein [Thermoplasmata archaeon]